MPDLVGHGHTSKPWQLYDRPAYLRWLVGFVETLGLGPVHLVGNSLGGALAVELGLRHPQLVKRVVLLDSVGFGWPRSPGPDYLRALLLLQTAPGIAGAATLASLMKATVAHPEKGQMQLLLLADYLVETLRHGGRRPFWCGQFPATRPFAPASLEQWSLPTHLVWGDKDQITPLDQAYRAESSLPGASLELIPDAGHAPHLDQPQAVATILMRHLAPRS